MQVDVAKANQVILELLNKLCDEREENKFLLAEVKRLEAELAEERRYWE